MDLDKAMFEALAFPLACFIFTSLTFNKKDMSLEQHFHVLKPVISARDLK